MLVLYILLRYKCPDRNDFLLWLAAYLGRINDEERLAVVAPATQGMYLPSVKLWRREYLETASFMVIRLHSSSAFLQDPCWRGRNAQVQNGIMFRGASTVHKVGLCLPTFPR